MSADASLRVNCLSPKGEFWNRLEQALDLSKNVLGQAKRDLGNSLYTFDTTGLEFVSLATPFSFTVSK